MTDVERRLFGTDGVRGVANDDITAEMAFNLARAAGDQQRGQAIIGCDTRRSGPMLASALSAGFNSVGIDTIDLGIIPVGAVSWLVRDTGSRYGVMVSASHNPAADNGIKFFGGTGSKLSDDEEAAIEHRYFQGHPWSLGTGADVGSQERMAHPIDRYVDLITDGVELAGDGLDLVVDVANGAAVLAAPSLFNRLGVTALFVNDQPDGMNINLECGALHPENLAAVADGKVGLAFDGDADRLIAVDEDGEIVAESGELEFAPWPVPVDQVDLIVWQPARAELDGEVLTLDGNFLRTNTFVFRDQVLQRPLLAFEWDGTGADISEVVTERLATRNYPLAPFLDGEPIRGDDRRIIAPNVQ
ncbi:MAG: hypothetical protein IIA44_01335, partial [Acidobacteria bacterium]|nr:hypothetical protein [Acidobacteriota bacterium]